MKPFSRLIRFESEGEAFFADLNTTTEIPSAGSSITAYRTYDDLMNTQDSVEVTFEKVCFLFVLIGNKSAQNYLVPDTRSIATFRLAYLLRWAQLSISCKGS